MHHLLTARHSAQQCLNTHHCKYSKGHRHCLIHENTGIQGTEQAEFLSILPTRKPDKLPEKKVYQNGKKNMDLVKTV